MNGETGFSDRFYWVRRRSGFGANYVARQLGCSQSLISGIENEGRLSSKFNDAFAKLFGVDEEWLRSGRGRAPEGFDQEEAGRARKAGLRHGRVVPFTGAATPRWAAGEGVLTTDSRDALQKSIINEFMSLARILGPEETKAFIDVLSRVSLLVSHPSKKAKRDDE